MHFRFQALLGILLVLGFCFSGGGCASGQPVQTSDAQNQLAKAFVLVQQADMAGGSPEQIARLANNINLTLRYTKEFARPSTASGGEALRLAKAARGQRIFRPAGAYLPAGGAR